MKIDCTCLTCTTYLLGRHHGEDAKQERDYSISVPAHAMDALRAFLLRPNGAHFPTPRLTVEAVQGGGILVRARPYRERAAAPIKAPSPVVRERAEWHEDEGPVLWWRFPIVEPPYCGTPLDDDFPEYATHWTAFATPEDRP